MDWIINHLFLLFIIAGAVASMVQKAKKAGTQQQARQVLDADAAERTRRVQEEIRRKIAARAGRASGETLSAAPSPAVGPSSAPRSRNIFQELAQQMAEARKIVEARERERAGTEARAQQRVLAEQETRTLAEVQRTLQKQQPTVDTAVADGGTGLTTVAENTRDKLLADLREPASLRRAWVLREILGEPVGLR